MTLLSWTCPNSHCSRIHCIYMYTLYNLNIQFSWNYLQFSLYPAQIYCMASKNIEHESYGPLLHTFMVLFVILELDRFIPLSLSWYWKEWSYSSTPFFGLEQREWENSHLKQQLLTDERFVFCPFPAIGNYQRPCIHFLITHTQYTHPHIYINPSFTLPTNQREAITAHSISFYLRLYPSFAPFLAMNSLSDTIMTAGVGSLWLWLSAAHQHKPKKREKKFI